MHSRPKDRSTQQHYAQIYIWPQDFRRLRELEWLWNRSRCKTISTLLDMASASSGCRPIRLDLSAWDRLEELARQLRIPYEDLASRILMLASHCSPDELVPMLSDEKDALAEHLRSARLHS